MASPIELIRGSERQTVYDNNRADILKADGWQRVDELPLSQQRELRDRPPVPWKGYDELGVADVLAQAATLPPERVQEVITYESRTKGRVGIVSKLLGRPEPVAAPVVEEVAAVEAPAAEAPKGKGKAKGE